MNEHSPSPPLLVRDLMSVGVPTCPRHTAVVDLLRNLLQNEHEGVVVLDEQGNALGVVTRDELVRAYAAGDYARLTVEAIMREGVPQVPPNIPLAAAAQIMQDLGTRVLFIMHHAGGIEYPAAFLSYRHFLRHMAVEQADDLADLGIKAAREAPLDAFIRRRDEARRRAGAGT